MVVLVMKVVVVGALALREAAPSSSRRCVSVSFRMSTGGSSSPALHPTFFSEKNFFCTHLHRLFLPQYTFFSLCDGFYVCYCLFLYVYKIEKELLCVEIEEGV